MKKAPQLPFKYTKKAIRTCKPLSPINNLDQGELIALENLRQSKDLHITKADKGDTVVVMTTAQYVSFAHKQLGDTSIYIPLLSDPTGEVVDGLIRYIIHLRNCGVINDHTANFLLLPIKTRTQRIYFFLPKLHKRPISFRPIVLGCNGPTEAVSAFIDHFLQPYMRRVPSFLKNSRHLVNILAERSFPTECHFVTLDVSSLYTNISHEDALDTLDLTFQNTELDLPYAPRLSVLKTLLKYV